MIRPLAPADAPPVLDLMVASFEDLDRRQGRRVEPPPPDPRPGHARIRHLARTDPGGAWAAEVDGRVVGAALALVREGLWGLSLLVVHPDHQSDGLGRELLERALAYGAEARGGIILSSEDPRALRCYARAGFDLRPTLDVGGPVRSAPERPAAVRRGRWPDDAALVDAASRHVRGASHAQDVPVFLANGRELLVHDEGAGYLVRQDAKVTLVAAERDELAADLLRAHLADARAGGDVELLFITAGQDWAVRVALDAGLELRPGSAVFTRGEVGPMTPYIPSGAYL